MKDHAEYRSRALDLAWLDRVARDDLKEDTDGEA